jgi:lipoate-protein ligase A
MWQVIESGSLSPASIMEKDQALLNQFESTSSHPILHLYEWEGKCLTYGYFTNPADHLNLSALQENQLHIARRPTGGGLIFHLTDFAFSVLIPSTHPAFSTNTLENYAFINKKIAQVIAELTACTIHPQLYEDHASCVNTHCLSFCMAQPTQYDLIVNGKKVGGAAQRRTKWGYLHQGSISLAMPPISLLKSVLKDKGVLSAMQQNTQTLLAEPWTPLTLEQTRLELKKLLKQSFMDIVC